MSKPKEPPEYTRRDVKRLSPEILGHYHGLVMRNDLETFNKLLEIYRVPEELREELRHEFTQYAERILRRRWRGPK
jgi:hypothetical protein